MTDSHHHPPTRAARPPPPPAQSSPDNAQSVITAMRSKGSVTFGSAGGAFTGAGEGAREYLGDLLM